MGPKQSLSNPGCTRRVLGRTRKDKKQHDMLFFASGAPTRIRTWDRLLKRELLYQLSYERNTAN